MKLSLEEYKSKSEKYESDWCENHAEIKYLKEQIKEKETVISLHQQKNESLISSEKHLISERDELAEALKKSMTITRQYVQRVKEESSMRYEVEKQLNICKNIKDSISSALLEMLHNERLKKPDNIGLFSSLKNIAEKYDLSDTLSRVNLSKDQDSSIDETNTTNHSLISSIQKASEGDYDWLFPQNSSLPLSHPLTTSSPQTSPSLVMSFKDIIEGELEK